MGYLPDGTLIDSNLRASGQPDAAAAKSSSFKLQVGVVVATYPIDDDRNLSKRYVEYDVMVNEDRRSAVTYRNLRSLDPFGGINDFQEVVFAPATNRDNADKDPLTDGSWVVVASFYGRKDQSVILAALQHQRFRLTDQVSPVPEFDGAGNSGTRTPDMKKLPTLLPGAMKADGNRILGEFNGFRWNINKDGEFTVMMQGIKDANGKLKNSDGGSIFKMDRTGRCTIIDRLDQEVTVSPQDKTVYIADGNSPPTTVAIQRSSKAVRIIADGPVTLQEGKGKVFVGGPSAAEPLVLGKTFSDFLTKMLQGFSTGFQALATASVGPLAPLKPGFTALALVCTQAAAQIPTLVSQKAFTELGP